MGSARNSVGIQDVVVAKNQLKVSGIILVKKRDLDRFVNSQVPSLLFGDALWVDESKHWLGPPESWKMGRSFLS